MTHDHEMTCPGCFTDLCDVWMESPWYIEEQGGPPSTAGGIVHDAWSQGIQRCTFCGLEFEVTG